MRFDSQSLMYNGNWIELTNFYSCRLTKQQEYKDNELSKLDPLNREIA